MADLLPVTLEDQLRCVEREIALRERVYSRWAESGKMMRQKADREIAVMRAVADTLRATMARASAPDHQVNAA